MSTKNDQWWIQGRGWFVGYSSICSKELGILVGCPPLVALGTLVTLIEKSQGLICSSELGLWIWKVSNEEVVTLYFVVHSVTQEALRLSWVKGWELKFWLREKYLGDLDLYIRGLSLVHASISERISMHEQFKSLLDSLWRLSKCDVYNLYISYPIVIIRGIQKIIKPLNWWITDRIES